MGAKKKPPTASVRWPDNLSDEAFRQMVEGLALQPLTELVGKLGEASTVEGVTGEPSATSIRADLGASHGGWRSTRNGSTLIGVAESKNAAVVEIDANRALFTACHA